MSFSSVFQKILHVATNPLLLKVAAQFPAASAFTNVFGFIGSLEAALPQAGIGPLKNDLAVQMLVAAHPGIDPAASSTSVSKIVTALKLLQEAETEFAALQVATAGQPMAGHPANPALAMPFEPKVLP